VALDNQRYFSIFDDAMISMRYAWNFSHGYGLVWNPGERVEGYTNLLMVLLMALPNLLFEKRIAALAVQLIGILCMLVNAYLAKGIAHLATDGMDGEIRKVITVLSFIGTLAYYPLAFWCLMGMETGLLTSFILAGVFVYLKFLRDQRTIWLFLLSIFLGLAFITRPDSLVPSLIIILFLLVELFRSNNCKQDFTRIVGIIGLFLLFPFGQFLFRLVYYGELLPNTYILKVAGIPIETRILNGFAFITPFMKSISVILIISVIGLFLNYRRSNFIFICLSLSLIIYQIWVGGDAWLYWRITAPIIPLLLIVFILTTQHKFSATDNFFKKQILNRATLLLFGLYFISASLTVDRPSGYPGMGPAEKLLLIFGIIVTISGFIPRRLLKRFLVPRRSQLLHIVYLSFIALVSINVEFLPEITFRVRPYTVGANIKMVNRAIAISELTKSNATVGVIYAGAIPYYTGLYSVDFLGKSDKYIAKLQPDLTGAVGWYGMSSVPGHNKYDLSYSIMELKPTYIQRASWGTQDLSEWVENNYYTVTYKGILLRFRKNDPKVIWQRISNDC